MGENNEGEIHYSSVVSRHSITSAEDFAGGFVGLNTESPITNSSVQLNNITGEVTLADLSVSPGNLILKIMKWKFKIS